MKKPQVGGYRPAKIGFIVIAVLFIILFVYVGVFENASVYQDRNVRSHSVIDEVTVRDIEDDQTPLGIKKEYRFYIKEDDTTGNTLAFYVVHQYVQVYVEDELVYSLTPKENNRLGITVGNNWVTVPVYTEDIGKEFRVVLTPVYESIKDRDVEFQYGSLWSIYVTSLKQDLHKIVLSVICVQLGFIIIICQCVIYLMRKSNDLGLVWLGIFSVLLGSWKITDTRFTPWLFPHNPLLVVDLSLGALFLIPVPILIFVRNGFAKSKTPILNSSIFTCIGAAAVAFICQIAGIADLRQIIPLCHVVIVFGLIAVLLTAIRRRHEWFNKLSTSVVVFTAALAAGAVVDFVLYYAGKNSSNTLCMMSVFVVYLVVVFIARMQDNARQVYTDSHTSLFNKKRWDNLMKEAMVLDNPVGVMMLDLNGLKVVNDTMGHEAGDKMLFNFANILRNTIPSTNVICRWGGDEFTVLVTEATREKMESYITDIRRAAESYNASGETPQIHFAAGYALSEEFPGVSHDRLLEKADERMYEDKKNWYAQRNIKKQ